MNSNAVTPESSFDALLSEYDYEVPQGAIATEPVSPRDSAKLLVYRAANDSTEHATFRNLPELLPENTLLVCNDTKVIPARLFAQTHAGDKVELFVTEWNREGGGGARVLSQRRLSVGDVVTILSTDGSLTEHRVHIETKEGKEMDVTLEADVSWHDILERYGTTPIPPYLAHTHLTEGELRTEYQTVFAKTEGSVAAPTASLHFTEELLEKLRAQGHAIVFVTLHVGLGTFAPLTKEHVASGELHREWYHVPEETIQALRAAKKDGRPIIPVGTTALRTLETIADEVLLEHTREHEYVGETRLFIRPGYQFKLISGLITNFHVPKSSLMMLVAALVGRERLLSLYAEALSKGYRFFSFGDGMLILRNEG